MTAERNSLDVIICDEAHRIRETSANRYTKADLSKLGYTDEQINQAIKLGTIKQ